MTVSGWLNVVLTALLLTAIAPCLGRYLAYVFLGTPAQRRTWLGRLELRVLRAMGAHATTPQHWVIYALSALCCSTFGALMLYATLRLQGWLPGNPEHVPGVEPAVAMNIAVSFATNTNWQAYVPETILSPGSQQWGLAVLYVLAPAVGMAIAVAVTRAFMVESTKTLGNFWVDAVRSIVHVLVPGALLLGGALVLLGLPQHMDPSQGGPLALQVALQQWGTNGGGFFAANSAHPWANPSPLTHVVQVLAMLALPAGLVHMFGAMVGDRRQGWALYSAMMVLWCSAMALVYVSEARIPPALAHIVTADQGMMEGKEVRFSIADTAIFATATTATSTGSTDAAHGSFLPLGAGILMLQMKLGEIIFGGVGSGLYTMLLNVVLAVFLAGLMVGRSPEYLGKKIEVKEVKLTMLGLLVCPALMLIGATSALHLLGYSLNTPNSGSPHALSELLYAYASTAANNGSAMGGFEAANPIHLWVHVATMWLGRMWLFITVLGVAGHMSAKQRLQVTPGTFPTHTWLFVGLLVSIILVVGGLVFLPSFALGPIAEELMIQQGMVAG